MRLEARLYWLDVLVEVRSLSLREGVTIGDGGHFAVPEELLPGSSGSKRSHPTVFVDSRGFVRSDIVRTAGTREVRHLAWGDVAVASLGDLRLEVALVARDSAPRSRAWCARPSTLSFAASSVMHAALLCVAEALGQMSADHQELTDEKVARMRRYLEAAERREKEPTEHRPVALCVPIEIRGGGFADGNEGGRGEAKREQQPGDPRAMNDPSRRPEASATRALDREIVETALPLEGGLAAVAIPSFAWGAAEKGCGKRSLLGEAGGLGVFDALPLAPGESRFEPSTVGQGGGGLGMGGFLGLGLHARGDGMGGGLYRPMRDARIPVPSQRGAPANAEVNCLRTRSAEASSHRPKGANAPGSGALFGRVTAVDGSLSASSVDRGIRAAFASLSRCLESLPELPPDLTLKLFVDRTGSVTAAVLREGTLPEASASCLVKTAYRLSFPAAASTTRVTYELRATPFGRK